MLAEFQAFLDNFFRWALILGQRSEETGGMGVWVGSGVEWEVEETHVHALFRVAISLRSISHMPR